MKYYQNKIFHRNNDYIDGVISTTTPSTLSSVVHIQPQSKKLKLPQEQDFNNDDKLGI